MLPEASGEASFRIDRCVNRPLTTIVRSGAIHTGQEVKKPACPSVDKPDVVHRSAGTVASNRKDVPTPTTVWVNAEDIILSEMSGSLQVLCGLCKAPGMVLFTDRGQKGGCQGLGVRGQCSPGTEFQFGETGSSGDGWWGWLRNSVNGLRTPPPYT